MSKGKSKTTTSNNQTLDPYSRREYERQRDRTMGVLDQGYQGSWGATGLSNSERQAGDLINQYVGGYSDDLGDVRSMINGATFTPGRLDPRTFADFDADTYVNPHSQGIIDATSGDIQEAADRARNGIKADNLAQGAYGGSRHGVREGLLDESMLDSIADMSARTRFDVWNQGADRFYSDVSNEMFADQYNADQINQGADFDLRRAGMLSDLVGQERSLQDQDIGRLMNYGATERGIEDQLAAREYDEYWRRIQAEMGLLGSVPMLVDSTGESTTRSNPGVLGTVGTLTGGISDLFNPYDGVFSWGGSNAGKVTT